MNTIYCTDPKTGKRFSFSPLTPERLQELNEQERRMDAIRNNLDANHKRAKAYAKRQGWIR